MLSCLSCVQLFVTLWTVACQTPVSMGCSRQDNWSGLPCPPPGDLPDTGTEPTSLMSPTLGGRFFITDVENKCYQWGGKGEEQDMGRRLKAANYYVYNK